MRLMVAASSLKDEELSGESEPPGAQEPGPPLSSLDEILRELRPKIRTLFASYRVPHEDAEDILQESLLAAVLAWGEIRNKEGWLLVVIRHGSPGWAHNSVERLRSPDQPPALCLSVTPRRCRGQRSLVSISARLLV